MKPIVVERELSMIGLEYDSKLRTLDLPTILASGYRTRTRFYGFPGRNSYCTQPTYSVPLVRRGKPFQFTITRPRVDQKFLILQHFPYVDDDKRLRIWDLDAEEPLKVVGRGVVDGAMLPEEVRRRGPDLFAFAQSLGYWLDVK